MKIFHCDHCSQLALFENTECLHCGHLLAYLPDIGQVASLDPVDGGLWRSPLPEANGRTYRQCVNYSDQQICNWAIDAADPDTLCASCRLTRVIPDLTVPGHREAWFRIEAAKRRLVYTLLSLGLPIVSRLENPAGGLAFDLLADAPAGQAPVLTGHDEGVITLNVAEANDVERERRRTELHEPYRTLLGHFRHEIGHYYWDQLIRNSDQLNAFRELFGDERQDYAQALAHHYETGPVAGWVERFVSAYAGSHPWEDWAETWAHYLHMTDTVETAAACGVSIRPRRMDEPVLVRMPGRTGSPAASFDQLIETWFPLTYVLNNLNRGLGLPDAYPFVLSTPVIDKLRFVHEIVALQGAASSATGTA
ncbi:MAG: putative zinc-binding peptidase [Acidobacteriota bacterium]